jgi:uncharacterized membrane protein
MSSSTAPAEVRPAPSGRGERARLAAGIAGLAGLQLAAHFAASASQRGGLTTLAPLLLPGAVAAWVGFSRSTRGGLMVLALLTVLAGAALLSPPIARHLPLLAQLAICLSVAWLFGRTLRPGAVPLVTQMAHAVHGTLPPAIEAYARSLTVAWTLFMLALGAASVTLFLHASLDAWSFFANVLLLPLVAVMFLAEYGYRTLRYSWFAHATLAQSAMAFQRLRAARRAPR